MDLVGLGQENTGGNQQSSLHDEPDLTKTSASDLLYQILDQTLKAYSIDQRLTSDEILSYIDPDEVETLT